ncbi:MAG: peptide chain release factor 1 [SAR324 cluster bacterium]|nr:peptide chain release factor 1 [SAR324 cluster bacterium]|tara:strand:- start:2930 stop:3997 length:1068 start_codon:yes stop_codon:yes gene_type:complete
MLDKLEEINSRFEKLTEELGQPEVVQDQNRYRKLTQEHAGLQEIVEAYQLYLKIQQQLEDNRELSEDKDEDPEIRKLAVQEIHELNLQMQKMQKQIELLLLPKDPDDSRNIIIEIRAGTGGDEAALFARDLFQMYAHYSESQKWRLKLMNESRNDLGGFKEITFSIEGKEVYSRLKYEGGVHRVQRVPKTETQGRIHTSAATVAVLPEVEDVEVEINPGDLRIDVYRSSGPGGQSVNTTDSAVRITHIPSGLVVICQNEKSQLKNKSQALKVLRARLYEKELEAQQSETAEKRRGMVGSGDRSERIRTYNFPQGRLTDHRINLTLYKLEDILLGKLEQVIDPLLSYYQAELLKAS